VTGFAKTLHLCTRIEIHFIACCNSHTCALFRHNNKTGVDKQVCFCRWPVFGSVKSLKTIIDPMRPLRCINRVTWGAILSHCMPARLVVWWGLLWPSVWPTVHATCCLCLKALLHVDLISAGAMSHTHQADDWSL